MSGPLGICARRSGMCSYHAWNAAARRSKNNSRGVFSSEISPAQLLSTSWSSKLMMKGAEACAACKSVSS